MSLINDLSGAAPTPTTKEIDLLADTMHDSQDSVAAETLRDNSSVPNTMEKALLHETETDRGFASPSPPSRRESAQKSVSRPTEHATLGQLAAQIQANARAAKEVSGEKEGENEEEDVDESDVCAPGEEQTGRWTRTEHDVFLEALKKYGKEWKKISSAVKTRTVVQTRTHAQKYFQKMTKGSSEGGKELYVDDDDGGFASPGSARRVSKRTRKPSSALKSAYEAAERTPASTRKTSSSSSSSSRAHTSLSVIGSTARKTPSYIVGAVSMPHSASGVQTTPMQGYLDLGGAAPSGTIRDLTMAGMVPADFPQPSPAACGTRKEDELSAASTLVHSSTKRKARRDGSGEGEQEMDGADALSSLKKATYRPGEIVRKPRTKNPSLMIINPDSLHPDGSNPGTAEGEDGGAPGTPWDKEMKALERRDQEGYSRAAVSTPSQQKDFMAKVRRCVQTGDTAALKMILRAASNSSSSSSSSSSNGNGAGEGIPRAASAKAQAPPQTQPQMQVQGQGLGQKRRSPRGAEAMQAWVDKKAKSEVGDSTSVNNSQQNAAVLTRTLNRLSSSGRTALMEACHLDPAMFAESTVLDICKALLESGASSSMVSPKGLTALHLATARGYAQVCRTLLNRGCPINQVDDDGNSALHVAATKGHSAMIELLADFGVNCHLRNKKNRSALDLCGMTKETRKGRDELRRVMLSVEPRLRTLILYHEDCLEHTARRADDWEGPDRLMGIMQRLQNPEEFGEHEVEICSQFDRAGVELLARAHSVEYITFVDNLSKRLQSDMSTRSKRGVVPFTPQVQREMFNQAFGDLKKSEYCDTSFSTGTLQAARRAAGAVAHAVNMVMLGRNRNAFCCVRPPGHHAGYNGLLNDAKSCGFCIFNSIASGALHALEAHQCERVAIVDLDVHHGNGTEDIVRRYEHPNRLLFFSLHLYDREPTLGYEFFPGSGQANDNDNNIINVPIVPMWNSAAADKGGGKGMKRRSSGASSQSDLSSVGSGGGGSSAVDGERSSPSKEGSSAHSSRGSSPVAMSRSGVGSGQPLSGREAYRQAVKERLLPSLRAFNPSLVLISAGFDPASGDVGNSRSLPGNSVTEGMDLLPEDFAWVSSEIMQVADLCCDGRVVSVLEGGYGSYATPPRDAFVPTTKITRSKKEAIGVTLPEPEEDSMPPPAPPVSDDRPAMNRHILAASAASYVRSLVDPYGESRDKEQPLLCVPVPQASSSSSSSSTSGASGQAQAQGAAGKGKGKGKEKEKEKEGPSKRTKTSRR